MRLALALVLVAGCLPPPADPPPDDPYGGFSSPTGDGCLVDAECSPQICARDRTCYPASAVRTAHVTWTVHGKPASENACAITPNLAVRFRGPSGDFGFAPVPCRNGSFFVDKFPTQYTSAEVGPATSLTLTSAPIDPETGEAFVALP